MKPKYIIQFAKIYSLIFSPFYAPLWVFLWLFLFSYLRMWPLSYKLFIMVTVLMFTIIIPRVAIEIFRRVTGWTHWQLSHRENRYIPYFLTIASYVACVFLFINLNTALFMRGIILATLMTSLACAVVNAWWKVSTHMAGMGGMVGTVISFSYLFYFNPIIPMCCMLLLSGIMGSSRMILRQHSLAQVLAGFLIGFVCALVFILIAWV